MANHANRTIFATHGDATSTTKVGGLRFIKIGRFCLSFCITRDYRRFP